MRTLIGDDDDVLVPAEPTDDMLRAGVDAYQHSWANNDDLADWRAAYKAMVKAAQRRDA